MSAHEVNDYFALLGLPRSTALDADELAQRYRKLQHHAHPDRHAGAPQLQRQAALVQASRINSAYTALKTPLSRAAHLLSLYGTDVYAEQDTAMPENFLQQQLEWREALSEDPDEQTRAALLQEITQARDHIAAAAKNVLDAVVAAQGGDTRAAYDLLRQWIYLEKLIASPEFLDTH